MHNKNEHCDDLTSVHIYSSEIRLALTVSSHLCGFLGLVGFVYLTGLV